MSSSEPLYVVGCDAANVLPDGTCTDPVWMPYHQPVLPPLSLADGTLVSFAIIAVWAFGLKARLIFRGARMGHF